MKIAFDAKRAFFNRSGLGNYSRSIISLLTQYYPDHSYHLFTPGAGPGIINPSPATHIHLPGNKVYESITPLWRSFGLIDDLKKLKPDLYHGLSNELPYGISRDGIKYIVTIHDLIFEKYPELYPLVDRKVYHAKFRHACRKADKIIAVSHTTKQDIVERYGIDDQKIEVAYQTCDPSFQKKVDEYSRKEVLSRLNLPEQFLLSVGTIEPRKNMLLILQALQESKVELPLVLIGRSTPYQQVILGYAEKYSLTNQLFIRNGVDGKDLPSVYQSAIAFVYPSFYEGFGIPILEALFSGTAVISSHTSCLPETGGDAALYFDPRNSGELAEKIMEFINTPLLKEKMIQKGFAHAESFKGEKIAQRIMEVYTQIIQD
jgi:glycosyltransferase involved in cell wall biosynthesis